MTAHPAKPTLTPDRIRWFADYYRKHPSWGAFHVQLGDGNYKLTADYRDSRGEHGEANAISWFNSLTESQRKRLGTRAQDLANTIVMPTSAAAT